MSRLLITAGSSFLGQSLVPLAISHHDVCYTYYQNDPLATLTAPGNRNLQRRQLDLRDAAATMALVEEWQPAAIIHLAGSNRTEEMAAVITRGTDHITRAAEMVRARLIHLSSDAIFDGRAAPYAEDALPAPLNAYGRAKAEAEAHVTTYNNHVIVRTSLIYHPGRRDHSTRWIADALQRREPVTLFTNQIRNPVDADSLSQACLELVDLPYCGVLNVAGRQAMSRAAFGRKLLDWWGVEERGTLRFGPCLNERWPLDTRLDLRLAESLLATPLPGVDERLAAAVRKQPTTGG